MTCTSGTPKHPILIYLLNCLIARAALGDPLVNASPLFALPISKNNEIRFLPLSYGDILTADAIRTDALGAKEIPIRTHLRRKGGASDLYDANISLDKIRAVGHWSFGILDAYLTFSATQIATWQNLGLARAEYRSSNNVISRVMVHHSNIPILHLCISSQKAVAGEYTPTLRSLFVSFGQTHNE